MKINTALTNKVKSNNVLIVMALLCLVLATVASALFWSDIPSAIKIGMYAFGFGTGVAAGVLIVRRKEQSL